MSTIQIKPLTPKYYESNRELFNTEITKSHFLARSRAISNDEAEGFITAYMGNPNVIYLVALYEDILIGHIFAIPHVENLLEHTANIGYLVTPRYRRKGICSMLMEKLISEAKQKTGIEILCAEVCADNKLSLSVLKKFGFTETGRLKKGLKKENGEYLDMIYFSRPVSFV